MFDPGVTPGATALQGEADIPAATRVIYGPEAAFTHIARELADMGVRRAFVITGRSLGKSALVARLLESLGDSVAGHFDAMSEHSPRSRVIAAADAAIAAGADALIAVGGGSAIVGTKGVALVMAEGRDFDRLKSHYDYRTGAVTIPRLTRPKLPVIAIPTTLSAGEFSSAMGITNDATGQKDKFIDAGVVPRMVILDPVMTIETPDRLWASTGVKALQNAIERYYARNANPFSEGLCLEAMRLVMSHLRATTGNPDNLDGRGRLQFLNWMTAFGAGRGGIGLGHGICHQLGAVAGIPHGISGCIVLPHMMAFNRPATAPRQRRIAEAMGHHGTGSDEQAAEWAAGQVRALVAELDLPARLRDAGVPHAALPKVAELTLQDRTLSPTPRPPVDAAEVLALLEYPS